MATQTQRRIQGTRERSLGSHPSSQLALEPAAKDLVSCLSPKLLPVEYLFPQLGWSSNTHTHSWCTSKGFLVCQSVKGEVNSTHRLPSHCRQRGSDSQTTRAECGQSPAAKPPLSQPVPVPCCSPALSGNIVTHISPQIL